MRVSDFGFRKSRFIKQIKVCHKGRTVHLQRRCRAVTNIREHLSWMARSQRCFLPSFHGPPHCTFDSRLFQEQKLRSWTCPDFGISSPSCGNLAILWLCSDTLNWVLVYSVGFPCSSDGKEPACSVGDPGSVPGLGRSWVGKKGMATHSSILAWRIPWTGEPGRLQSMGCKESDRTEQLTHTYTDTHIVCTFSAFWPLTFSYIVLWIIHK